MDVAAPENSVTPVLLTSVTDPTLFYVPAQLTVYAGIYSGRHSSKKSKTFRRMF